MALTLKNLHILVVEDIAPMRELTVAVLGAQGVGKISYAGDGEKGFEIFCKENPDIVLTDWQMPGVNGTEMSRLIRTSPRSPNQSVPIIMMTGFGSPLRISQARNVGVTEFLIKPFSASDLSKRILHVIKNPRDFIITVDFAGPDRRRKKETGDYTGPNNRVNPTGYLRKTPASKFLQSKVGLGLLDDDKIAQSQRLLDENRTNFVPIALRFLAELRDALDMAKRELHPSRRSIERMVDPVMQIKANARIFKYDLLGNLAGIMLNFLDNLNEIDDDVVAIVDAHHKTVSHILMNEMTGDGGHIGGSLETELTAACLRYTNSRAARQKKQLEKALAEKKSATQ